MVTRNYYLLRSLAIGKNGGLPPLSGRVYKLMRVAAHHSPAGQVSAYAACAAGASLQLVLFQISRGNRELQAVTPDSLQDLVHDLSAVNTFWKLETEQATAK